MNEESLSKQQIEQLSGMLVSLKNELEAALLSGRENSKPVMLDQPTVGRLSRMDAMQQQEMAKATRLQMESRLRLVKTALRTLESDDDYGYCRECGECIGFKRLQVRPEAPFCLDCQSVREKR